MSSRTTGTVGRTAADEPVPGSAAVAVPAEPGGTSTARRTTAASRLWGQIGRFTVVGVLCTAASIGLYALLRPSVGPQWANALALVSTSILNTALNRAATFRIQGGQGAARDHARGLLVMGIAWVITASSLALLHWVQPHATVTEELWTTTLAGLLATVVRFTLFRQWIFRRARNA